MSEKVEDFLKKIGPRDLTDAEARALLLLRLEEGEEVQGIGGLTTSLAKGEDKGGTGKSKFLK
jgi:hypothetical protein